MIDGSLSKTPIDFTDNSGDHRPRKQNEPDDWHSKNQHRPSMAKCRWPNELDKILTKCASLAKQTALIVTLAEGQTDNHRSSASLCALWVH
jgi:hypothetical protein